MAASAFHRYDPGEFLANAFYYDDLRLRARSLKAVGELGGRGDKLIPVHLKNRQKVHDPASRFQAAWSSLLLGDTTSLEHLRAIILDETSPFREEALQVSARRMNLKEAQALQGELAKKADSQRLAVIGEGIIGDPALIPWLVKQMKIPALARIAAQSFSFITGLDISGEQLEGTWPEGFEAGPNDDPTDDNVETDPDENLPWPDPEKIYAWWETNKDKYPRETRLLLGKPITPDHLQHILQTGRQRQRAAAALELALLKPGKPIFNTAAPAKRQMEALFGENKTRSDVKPIVPNYGTRPLAITAANCITPVGLTAAQTAASVRAGIMRFALSNDYSDASGKPVTVAKIQGVRDDVANVIERIRDVAVVCLKDLLEECFGNNRQRPKVHFLLGVPSEKRPGPDYGKKISGSIKIAIEKISWISSSQVITRGNASLYHTISQASRAIDSQPDTLCILGCVDSLHRESILDYFEEQGRLKSPGYGRQNGLIASEAAAFLMVEDLEQARRAGRPILARISTLGLAEERQPRSSEQTGSGKGLTEACQRAMEPLKEVPIFNILGDLNGEDTRAEEWDTVQLRCFPKDRAAPFLRAPAESYGDIGAASGGVLACIAAEGFKRNWLNSPAMIFCSDDFGPCGAVVLEKAT
jgi:3-oxoacyl-[acyl-carrier-protein] synthase-1